VRAFFMVSQALMPKRCNVLLETVKELPPLQVLEKKGVGLCHDQTVSRRLRSISQCKTCGGQQAGSHKRGCDIGTTVECILSS
jgi:ribosomal protein L37AE/L43A